jgi:hypothetical protein
VVPYTEEWLKEVNAVENTSRIDGEAWKPSCGDRIPAAVIRQVLRAMYDEVKCVFTSLRHQIGRIDEHA